MEPNRFEVWVKGDKFVVIDEETGWESKEYTYHRWACELMSKLEDEHRANK